MSVNSKHAMNSERVKRFGKLFGSIDFTINENVSTEIVKQRKGDTTVGTFEIGGKSFKVTLAEINRIIETAEAAKSVFNKSYSMGRFGY